MPPEAELPTLAEMDLLRDAELGRGTETIWFLRSNQLTSREALVEDLSRLESLGWIEQGPHGRWFLASPGRRALFAGTNWVFQVDEIASGQEEDAAELIAVGHLIAGSPSFFFAESPLTHLFTHTRGGVAQGGGHLKVQPNEDASDSRVVISLRLEKKEGLHPGDLLKYREFPAPGS